jgi:transcriptional regulator with XRE-family HTH domain
MKRLDCYVNTHRRARGLTQPELAFLLGWKSGSQISLLEKTGREPKLTTAFALELLFGAEPTDLFPKLLMAVEDELMRRAYELRQSLKGHPSKKNEGKILLLDQAMKRVTDRIKEREE